MEGKRSWSVPSYRAILNKSAGNPYGDAGMHSRQDRVALGGIDPIAQCIEPLMQLGPERKAVSGRRGSRNRSQTGDMLMPDPAVGAVGRYEETAQQHDLAEIPECQSVAQSAEHDEGDDVARQRRSVEDAVAALVELPAAVPTPEPMIALCCQVWPLGHRRRATAYAIHRNQPPPRGIRKLIWSCQPRGARRDRPVEAPYPALWSLLATGSADRRPRWTAGLRGLNRCAELILRHGYRHADDPDATHCATTVSRNDVNATVPAVLAVV